MKKFLKVKRIVAGILLPAFLIFISACGGAKSGDNKSTDITIPEDFNQLVSVVNNQSKTLTTAAKDFAEKYNTLNEFDPTTATGSDIVKPLEEMIDAAEVFEAALTNYNTLIEAYDGHLTSATTGTASVKAFAPLNFKQSVDPLFMLDIKNLIADGKTEAEAINQLIEDGADPNEAHEAMNAYKKKHLGNAFKTGVTALVGGGAGVIAGLAAGTAGAPVLVATGIGVGTGIVVGAIWSWCTSGSDVAVKTKTVPAGTCAMAAVQGTTTELPDGSTGVALTLPAGGPGDLCLHIDGKAPVCFNTTVDPNGNTVLTGCFSDGESGDASAANSCATGTSTQDGINVNGTDCATHVKSVNAQAAVSGGATVTVYTSLPTPGCSISYSVVGTDGYTQNGSPTTSASGTVSFSIPGGAEGVHDTVTITETASGSSTTIGYTF